MDVRYLRETVRWLSELAAMTAPMGAVLDYLERFKIWDAYVEDRPSPTPQKKLSFFSGDQIPGN